MRLFKNILAGVDVSRGEHLVADRLPGHTERAWQTALRLAKANSSRLTFLHVMQLSAETQHLIQMNAGLERSVVDLAKERLAALVDGAKREGVVAESRFVIGRCWVELVRQVYRDGHDLVIVGTRQFGTFKSLLLSTGAKLLRKCPCATLITKPGSSTMFESILVPHDTSDIGKTALETAILISKQHNSQLHILEPSGKGDEIIGSVERMRSEVASRSGERLWLEERIKRTKLISQPLVHRAETSSYCGEIMEHIERHNIGLVVLGTEACTGITWMFRRNVAERLASGIPCSLLVVKPPELMSSVSVEDITSLEDETRDQIGA